jgi:type II secretory pathway component PulF
MAPQNLFAAALLGAALLWAVQLVYGSRVGRGDDWLKLMLVQAGWLLILGGTLLPLMIVLAIPTLFAIPVLVAIVLSVVHQYRRSERDALLWTLAHAAERGVPLPFAIRSFAYERTDEVGSRAWKLAEALESGLPLDEALRVSRNYVSPHVLVATRTGLACGMLPEALRGAVMQSRDMDRALRSSVERLIYLVCLATILAGVLTFVMVKIVPTFERMFFEFELELPAVTLLLVAISQVFVKWSFLSIFVTPVILVILVAAFFYYIGWLPLGIPGVGWLRFEYDRTSFLRALALLVESKQPLSQTLVQLEFKFPTQIMRRRILRAWQQCASGGDAWDAMHKEHLITSYEQTVLQSAERVGNLPWALRVLADTAVKRLATRVQRWSVFLYAILFMAISGMVFLYAVGLITPLPRLILNLS